MVEQNEAIIDRMKALKEKCGKTSKEIARDCNLPESTVTRIFSGKTPNPTVATVVAITKAMGGKASDIFDDDVIVDIVNDKTVISSNEHKEIVEIYKKQIKVKDKWIKSLFILLAILLILFALLLAVDVLNGNIGFARY